MNYKFQAVYFEIMYYYRGKIVYLEILPSLVAGSHTVLTHLCHLLPLLTLLVSNVANHKLLLLTHAHLHTTSSTFFFCVKFLK